MIVKKEDNSSEIDLLEVVKLLWSKGLSIVLASLLVAIVVFGITLFFVKPKYEATASMYVNNSSFSIGASSFSISSSELTASNNLVNAYIYILNSRQTLEQVIEKTGVNYTYEELLKHITTNAVSSTAAFEVTVESTDPSEAELIANTIADVLPGRVAEIVDGASVKIVDYAIIPAHRSSPSYLKNILIGTFVGALIACIWIFLKQLIEDSENILILGREELKKRYSDIPVLAVIPDARYSMNKKYYNYSSYYTDDSDGGVSNG